jgi:SAM-dependent methyltransferase
VSDEVSFRRDLYRGTAGYYERFRHSYPDPLIADLVRRTGASGRGRLLDLACGTGQLAFALRDKFAEIWAVDQEPDMVAAVRSKSDAGADGGRMVTVVSSAEDLDAPPGRFSLVVIGNAFHRLRRDLVAQHAYDWLAPAGFIALCWSSGPGVGPLDWQLVFGSLLRRWQEALGASDRVPANWHVARQDRPDTVVLSEAGFDVAGRFEFPVEHRWTVPELVGYARSLSVFPAPALADHSAAFEASLAEELDPFLVDGHLAETVSFAYELARKPA